jgi:hypothetical protein
VEIILEQKKKTDGPSLHHRSKTCAKNVNNWSAVNLLKLKIVFISKVILLCCQMERNLPVKCPTSTERDAPKFYGGYLSPPGKKVLYLSLKCRKD